MKKKNRWKSFGSLPIFHHRNRRCLGRWKTPNLDSAVTLLSSSSRRRHVIVFLAIAFMSAFGAIFNADCSQDAAIAPSNRNVAKRADVVELIPAVHDADNRTLLPIDCHHLLMGQFICPLPVIDPETQQPVRCGADNLAPVNCTLRDGLICDDDDDERDASTDTRKRYVTLAVRCEHTNGYSYEVTLLLSIFFGMFGLDRFYLGYPAIGLLKFCTLGFLFLGQFIDIILIALQVVGPADGSAYIIKSYGPKLTILQSASYVTNANTASTERLLATYSMYDIFYVYDRNRTIVA